MKRLVLALLMMVAASFLGGYVYISQLERSQAEEVDRLNLQLNKSAQIVSHKVKQWQKEALTLAENPTLIQSLKTGVPALNNWLDHYELLNDEVGLFRVLSPDLMYIDHSQTPPLGYAGLDLLRKVVASKQMLSPEVHMLKSESKHIAVAAPVIVDKQVLAVVLLSLKLSALEQSFNAAVAVEPLAFFSLNQEGLQIFAGGSRAAKQEKPVQISAISGTQWKISIYKKLTPPPLTYFELQGYVLMLAAIVFLLVVLFSVLSDKEKQQLIRQKIKSIKTAKKTIKAEPVSSDEDLAKQVDLVLATSIKEKTSAYDEQPTNPIFMEEGAIEVVGQQEVPNSIFKAYDIRGIVDNSLTEHGVFMIGRAIASEALAVGQKTLVVARDGRLHSSRLSDSLVKGIQESGCDVIDIGQVPTPVLYFATHTLETQSGVMVTGSHNPANYNGLKVVIAGNALSGDGIQQLYRRVDSADFAAGEGAFQQQMILPEYIGEISTDIRLGRMMKVVVDCGNGVAGEAAPMLLSTLGCEVVPLYCDIDGNFPNHHPDPSRPENLQDLIDKVREEEAELGLAFDGDGDRLGVVDSDGNIIWPDRQMMLYAIDVLSRQAGADIIYDVKCTRNLAKLIAKYGGKPVMSKTGHSLMKAKMKESKAELGGEMSGHIFFKERWYGFDDALYTSARLLEVLTSEFRSTADIFAELPDSIATPEININMDEGENFLFIDKLQKQANFGDAKVITLDGLRVEFKDGWGLVRASNTTPSLVLRFEADNEQELERIKQVFKEQMLKTNTELELTF